MSGFAEALGKWYVRVSSKMINYHKIASRTQSYGLLFVLTNLLSPHRVRSDEVNDANQSFLYLVRKR